MLKSGTTCFLESILTHRAAFDNVVKAVEESGIRAGLVSHLSTLQEIYSRCRGKLVKVTETNS
jgi:hypothetical protein